MKKAQEGMIRTMKTNNWLELELVRGINHQGLQKRILRERNPMLQDMISIATLWQSAETTRPSLLLTTSVAKRIANPKKRTTHITYKHLIGARAR